MECAERTQVRNNFLHEVSAVSAIFSDDYLSSELLLYFVFTTVEHFEEISALKDPRADIDLEENAFVEGH